MTRSWCAESGRRWDLGILGLPTPIDLRLDVTDNVSSDSQAADEIETYTI